MRNEFNGYYNFWNNSTIPVEAIKGKYIVFYCHHRNSVHCFIDFIHVLLIERVESECYLDVDIWVHAVSDK